MRFLVLQAYLHLRRFDRYLATDAFNGLYTAVRQYPLRAGHSDPEAVDRICSAIDNACIWRWKQVLCLQRSAATVCLLRRYGIHAELVIGARQMPFKAHAWVEVAGKVVNDKSYTPSMYAVLDRC